MAFPRVRLTKVDEYQLLTCIKSGLWGSKTSRFKDWRRGDCLVIIVDKALAALGRVAGEAHRGDDRVWDNGLFPHRIPVEYSHVLLPEHRPAILGPIRDALASAWPDGGYGLAILNQLLLPEDAARAVIEAIEASQNDRATVVGQLDQLLATADAARATRRATPAPASELAESAGDDGVAAEADGVAPGDERLHFEIQHQLIQLGRVCGCAVWIATNDRNRTYQGQPLGRDCLADLPNLGLSPEAAKRIALIDIIWVRQGMPVYAFEVETTTSVFSGLLRMADLLALVPMIKVKLFVVAPSKRQLLALGQLRRPTFSKIGLTDYCSFVPSERLGGLLERVSDLRGHVEPSIVETISVAAEEVASAL